MSIRKLTCRFCRSDKAFTPHPTRYLGADARCVAGASYLAYEGLTCRFCRLYKASTPHPTRLAAGYLTFLRLAGHNGAIHLETPGLRNHFMEAKCLIQHVRIRQEGVRYNSQLAAAIKMTHRAANQRLRRIQAGLASHRGTAGWR
ncbi:Uncharacterised protein [Escherichia coli]|uniref:Uncharacterized protein n=1 Tax=Escherichia coli TaxID=562 RepID=A0A2X1N3V3_ECOLX|nr:Uncharacterised protein [Escherichia coli]